MITAPIYSIDRFRINTDGHGIRTLVALHGCPLDCKYCINPESRHSGNYKMMTTEELHNAISVDDMYMMATKGGVTFGGGEPLLYADFIKEYMDKYSYGFPVVIETSLNVPFENVEKVASGNAWYIVDIKSLNRQIYGQYTGKSNQRVLENLEWLMNKKSNAVTVRIPLIPDYNSADDVAKSKKVLVKAFDDFGIDEFEYVKEVPRVSEKESAEYGHSVCKSLTDIRHLVAEENGIRFEAHECNHTGPCSGTCSFCDAEYDYIKSELIKDIGKGREIRLYGIMEKQQSIEKKPKVKYRRHFISHQLTGLVLPQSDEYIKFCYRLNNERWALSKIASKLKEYDKNGQ